MRKWKRASKTFGVLHASRRMRENSVHNSARVITISDCQDCLFFRVSVVRRMPFVISPDNPKIMKREDKAELKSWERKNTTNRPTDQQRL